MFTVTIHRDKQPFTPMDDLETSMTLTCNIMGCGRKRDLAEKIMNIFHSIYSHICSVNAVPVYERYCCMYSRLIVLHCLCITKTIRIGIYSRICSLFWLIFVFISV